MEIDSYLKRINYHGSREPTAETLRELQVAHLYSVPFENLSIHAKEPIVLNNDALFDKIVNRRRGGFCYELNGLFAALLRSLGFQVEMLAAEVAGPDGVFGPKFDHMALMVKLSEPWLADVGFGDSFLEPVLLNEATTHEEGERAYRITRDDLSYTLEQRDKQGEWKPQYRFELDSYEFPDFEEMCVYNQTSPESHFTQKRICSRATPDGRISLSGLRMITTRHGAREERTLSGPDEYAKVLQDSFGIVLT